MPNWEYPLSIQNFAIPVSLESRFWWFSFILYSFHFELIRFSIEMNSMIMLWISKYISYSKQPEYMIFVHKMDHEWTEKGWSCIGFLHSFPSSLLLEEKKFPKDKLIQHTNDIPLASWSEIKLYSVEKKKCVFYAEYWTRLIWLRSSLSDKEVDRFFDTE